jgi:hypothetical protein
MEGLAKGGNGSSRPNPTEEVRTRPPHEWVDLNIEAVCIKDAPRGLKNGGTPTSKEWSVCYANGLVRCLRAFIAPADCNLFPNGSVHKLLSKLSSPCARSKDCLQLIEAVSQGGPQQFGTRVQHDPVEFWMQIALCIEEEEKKYEQATKTLRQTRANGLLGRCLVQTVYAYQCSDCGEVAHGDKEMNERAQCSYVLGLSLSNQAPTELQQMVDEYQAPRPMSKYKCPHDCHANQQRVARRRRKERSQRQRQTRRTIRTRSATSEQQTATRVTRSSTAPEAVEPEGQGHLCYEALQDMLYCK